MALQWWKIDVDEVKNPYYLVVNEQYIGRVAPGERNANSIENSLKAGNEPAGLYKIPFNYVKTIHIEEGKPGLVVRFGEDSEEVYPMRSIDTIFGIFHYIKENRASVAYELEKPSALQSGKKILIAAVILSALFGWAYYVALGLESGGDPGRQLLPVALLAGLGTRTLTMIYALIAGLCLVLLLQKVGRPVVRHVLKFR